MIVLKGIISLSDFIFSLNRWLFKFSDYVNWIDIEPTLDNSWVLLTLRWIKNWELFVYVLFIHSIFVSWKKKPFFKNLLYCTAGLGKDAWERVLWTLTNLGYCSLLLEFVTVSFPHWFSQQRVNTQVFPKSILFSLHSRSSVMDWMFVFSQDWYGEILTPNVIVLGGGTLGGD